MFPYFETLHWHLGPVAFRPFLVLVAAAIAVGYSIGLRRAERDGVTREAMSELALFVMAGGFLGAHVLKLIYSPGGLTRALLHPRELLDVFNGLASFGAFAGAVVAGLFFFWRHSIPVPEWFIYSEAGAFAVPFAWCIGRVCCYLVHDHPGLRTSSWLGVQYPGGTRYDLGLLEALFLAALGALFWALDRWRWPRGFYCAVFLLSYGAFRFLLDGLHVDPPRYLGWTVDQIAASLMIVTGLACILEMRRLRTAASAIN